MSATDQRHSSSYSVGSPWSRANEVIAARSIRSGVGLQSSFGVFGAGSGIDAGILRSV